VRVGIVSNEFPPAHGGVGQSVRRIARGIASAGADVSVIVLPADSNRPAGMQPARHRQRSDGSVQVYWLSPAVRRSPSEAISSERDIACLEWLCDFAVEKGLDLLHSFYISHTGLITGLAAHECSLPFIASVRGNDLHQDIFNAQRLGTIRWTLQNADMVTFVCASLSKRAALIDRLRGPARVIWNSIDPDDFEPPTRTFEISADLVSPVIASSGIFRRKKGIERLLEACSTLGREATLLLIGDFSWAEHDYWFQHVLPNAPPALHLVVTGVVPHSAMLSYLSLADVVVFPSIHDGCPNGLLEAMLAARPILCTRAGAMGDIMDQSHGGIVVEPCSVDRLAGQINRLLDDQLLCRALGERARAFVLEHLTPEIEARAWLDCYDSLLEAR
jgi:glycosyltransferase involved in cell wall biosynthesis